MEKKDIASQAEMYKREMMKLYGRNSGGTPAKEERSAVEQAENNDISQVQLDTQRKIETEPLAEPDTIEESDKNIVDEIEERYPEPDLSELSENKSSSAKPEMSMSKGYILVNVRTGDDSEPIENALVVITDISDGKRILIASGTTNESGITQKFEVSVPDAGYSLTPEHEVMPYSTFDISVTADSFFNARSVDVPVFAGITSVQNFSLIPIPLYMKSNDETVTYFNQEPNL